MAPTRNQPPPGFERFYKPLNKWDKLAFYYDHWAKPSYLKSERIISYLMWESTGIPKDIIAEINRSCRLLYVPSEQNAEAYRDNGVHIPVKVLHHGVDPARFPYLERTPKEVFTFGSFGEFSARKGIDVLIRAFEDEFLPHEPVRLLLKTFRKGPSFEVKDPRIVLFTKYLEHDDLLEFLRSMDVFVLPSRGEGFGLAGLEAMSTGLPIVATNWSGPVEYLNARDSFPLNYKLVDAKGTVAHGVHFQGQWAEPDYEHLRYLLRYLYEHPQEAAEKGHMAAMRAHREWTRERLAVQMIHDLDEIAAQE
jgi:glycosyltransferase involved in cell wall biosynthesis